MLSDWRLEMNGTGFPHLCGDALHGRDDNIATVHNDPLPETDTANQTEECQTFTDG